MSVVSTTTYEMPTKHEHREIRSLDLLYNLIVVLAVVRVVLVVLLGAVCVVLVVVEVVVVVEPQAPRLFTIRVLPFLQAVRRK